MRTTQAGFLFFDVEVVAVGSTTTDGAGDQWELLSGCLRDSGQWCRSPRSMEIQFNVGSHGGIGVPPIFFTVGAILEVQRLAKGTLLSPQE